MIKNDTKGIVGIFDALGAKHFSLDKINHFIESRQVLLDGITATKQRTKGAPLPDVFTINDTVIFSISFNHDRCIDEHVIVRDFFTYAREFIGCAICKGILFRGAISIGNYIANKNDNIIMGEAVSDAASWYEKSKLFGGFTTPRATIFIDKYSDVIGDKQYHYLFKKEIKYKTSDLDSYCVNWPQIFFVSSIRPKECKTGFERKYFIEKLSEHYIDYGTEDKYFNSIAFFDEAVKMEQLKRKSSKSALGNPAPRDS